MKKITILIVITAIAFSGCGPGRWVGANTQLIEMRNARRAQIKIKEGEAVAFKDIAGKNIILEKRPETNDSITISVTKP